MKLLTKLLTHEIHSRVFAKGIHTRTHMHKNNKKQFIWMRWRRSQQQKQQNYNIKQ